LAVTVLPAAGYYWLTLPQRTWNGFLVAFENAESAQVNALCDPRTLHFAEMTESEHELIISVSKPDSPKFSRTISLAELREFRPSHRSVVDYILGRQKMGASGSVLFGQLQVRRFHVAFEAD